MQRLLLLLLISVTVPHNGHSQITYFPERHAQWETRSSNELSFNKEALNELVAFAEANEYLGSRDLRIAILKGFEREPFHEILGPTKKRGGPAGLILKDGYLIASWGDTKRVDMTFSVTKSFLSTIAGLAVDENLIKSEQDLVKDYVWDGTFSGEHNAKITFKHLLQQNSDWSGNYGVLRTGPTDHQKKVGWTIGRIGNTVPLVRLWIIMMFGLMSWPMPYYKFGENHCLRY